MLLTNFLPDHCCGGRTRTCDLQVMSLASYQLLHSASLGSTLLLFPICDCKGTTLFLYTKLFSCFFSKNNHILVKIGNIDYFLHSLVKYRTIKSPYIINIESNYAIIYEGF